MAANPLQSAISAQLKKDFFMDDAAPKKMAAVAKAHILAGVKQGLAPKEAVAHACHGVLAGLMFIDKPLPKGAVSSLYGVNETALEQNWDPVEAMTWAMDGMARIKPAVPENVLREIEIAIDGAFNGAGPAFQQALTQTA